MSEPKNLQISKIEDGVFYVSCNDRCEILTSEVYEKKLQSLRDGYNEKIRNLASPETFKRQLHQKNRTWIYRHKGTKKGSGRRSDAMMIANSVRGMSVKEIAELKYPCTKYKNKRYSTDKVYLALSVNKEGDWERITKLYNEYQNEFQGISNADLLKWYEGRRKNEPMGNG